MIQPNQHNLVDMGLIYQINQLQFKKQYIVDYSERNVISYLGRVPADNDEEYKLIEIQQIGRMLEDRRKMSEIKNNIEWFAVREVEGKPVFKLISTRQIIILLLQEVTSIEITQIRRYTEIITRKIHKSL